MGKISEIQSLIKMGARAAATKNELIRKNIASAANDSIFQFPCLITDTVPIDMASATVRLIDRNYATFVQLVLSQITNVDISKYPTPVQFLQSVHQNMRVESVEEEDDGTFEYLREGLYNGELAIISNPQRKIAIALEGYEGKKLTNLRQLNIEQCREFLSDYNIEPFMEADITASDDLTREDIIAGMIQNKRNDMNVKVDAVRQKIQLGKKGPTIGNHDVKKINELQPYAIEVRLNVINDNLEFVEYWDLVVGVKAILHLIPSEEMIENIFRSISNKSMFFRFLRWTTGEISFFKDLILNLDEIKYDHLSRAKGYSRFFPTLRRLKDRKVSFRNFKPSMLVPNSTIVISNHELMELQNRYGINMKDPVMARRFMKNQFIMTFIILDEGTQTVEIMYYDDSTKGSFQIYPLEALERDVSLNSNRLGKEIGRMISR